MGVRITRPLWASGYQKSNIMAKKTNYTRNSSYRKPGKDYTLPGYYFITINTNNWQRLFGKKSGNKIILNDAGTMISETWLTLPKRFPHINLDESIIMPDHFHAIVQITDTDQDFIKNTDSRDRSLSKIIGAFKSITTSRYINGVRENNWPPFQKKLWHFRFFDRIIPNNKSLQNTRNYIIENPSKWNP